MVLPVIATARAFAPSFPILLLRKLKRGGRVRSRLNNVLIQLHNYTADIYRGWGGILLEEWVCGLVWNMGVD